VLSRREHFGFARAADEAAVGVERVHDDDVVPGRQLQHRAVVAGERARYERRAGPGGDVVAVAGRRRVEDRDVDAARLRGEALHIDR
jgi:hypothetical protein